MPIANPEAKKTYMKQWRINNKAKISAKCKEYYMAHKREINANNKEWKKANPAKKKEADRKYYQAHKEQYNALYRKYSRELTDSLVKKRIINHTSLKYIDVPQSMVQAKRAELQFQRLIKEQQNENEQTA